MAKISIIQTALWDGPRWLVFAGDSPAAKEENGMIKVPGFCLLIQDKKIGNILWDTGINTNWNDDWSEEFKQAYTFHFVANLADELAKHKLKAEDIDLVILSHMHFDHAGNVKLFKDTLAGKKIMVSDAEANEAFTKVCMSPDGTFGAYLRDELVMKGIGYKTINEDTWLSDDIFLFLQRGHTPGLIGLLVKTEENGNFIFTGDAVSHSRSYNAPIDPPGLCMDMDAYMKNLERLHEMQNKYNAKIVFGHDLSNFNEVLHSPHIYR